MPWHIERNELWEVEFRIHNSKISSLENDLNILVWARTVTFNKLDERRQILYYVRTIAVNLLLKKYTHTDHQQMRLSDLQEVFELQSDFNEQALFWACVILKTYLDGERTSLGLVTHQAVST